MIRHICMFKLHNEGRTEKLSKLLFRARELKEIPQIANFEIVTNAEGMPDTNYDVALIFDFDTPSDLASYQADPIHVEFGKFVATVREARACIDFEI